MPPELECSLYGESYVQNDVSIINRWLLIFGAFCGIPFIVSLPVLKKMIDSGCGLYLLCFLGVFGFSLALNIRLLFRIAKESGILKRHYNKVSSKFKFNEEVKQSVLATHIQNLRTMWKQSGNREITQESLIEITHAKLKSEGSLVILFSNVMITLGLIGTISGLIVSVSGLTVAAGNDGFMSGLNTALSGVGEAFYTTLVGSILGGVSLRVLHFYVDKKIDQFILGLAELIEVKIMPEFRMHQRKTDLRRVAIATLKVLDEMNLLKGNNNEIQNISLSA